MAKHYKLLAKRLDEFIYEVQPHACNRQTYKLLLQELNILKQTVKEPADLEAPSVGEFELARALKQRKFLGYPFLEHLGYQLLLMLRSARCKFRESTQWPKAPG